VAKLQTEMRGGGMSEVATATGLSRNRSWQKSIWSSNKMHTGTILEEDQWHDEGRRNRIVNVETGANSASKIQT